MVPAKGGPKILNLKSSWHRSKTLAVTQTLEGEEGGGGTPLLLRCTAVLMHHWGWTSRLRECAGPYFLRRESSMRGEGGWLSSRWVGGEEGGFENCGRWGARAMMPL